jgi:hypothetical protein
LIRTQARPVSGTVPSARSKSGRSNKLPRKSPVLEAPLHRGDAAALFGAEENTACKIPKRRDPRDWEPWIRIQSELGVIAVNLGARSASRTRGLSIPARTTRVVTIPSISLDIVQCNIAAKCVMLLIREAERAVEVVVPLPSLLKTFGLEPFEVGQSRRVAKPNVSRNFPVVT